MTALILLANGLKVPTLYWILTLGIPLLLTILAIIAEMRSWMPYAEKNKGLFDIKECYNEKTEWSGTQTLITPKGRETFRLLTQGLT